MYKIWSLALILFVFAEHISAQPLRFTGFISPLKGGSSFSGNFGELRSNHFHSGLDFRTGGETGWPVLAVKEGYVSRLSISPFGYGKALYIDHLDGHTSVYGHLSKFDPDLERYVKEQQYQKESFAIDVSPPKRMFRVNQGDRVAWSGNTGSSAGPHLHFEIRETESEKPQNPLFFIPGIKDNSCPKIKSVFIYPLVDGKTQLSGKKRGLTLVAKGKSYSLQSKLPIEVNGNFGVGFQADDDFNGAGNRCGIYSARLTVDKQPILSFAFDHLSFNQSRYINSHIDYEELILNKRWVQRLFLLPGNKMDLYKTGDERGIIQLKDSKTHLVRIEISDAFGNESIVSFPVKSTGHPTLTLAKKEGSVAFFHNRSNTFETKEVKVKIPEDCLYDDLPFVYKRSDGNGPLYSAIHSIHDKTVPLQKAYSLSIKSSKIPENLRSKALIVEISSGGKLTPVGGTFENGWVEGSPNRFGNFAIAVDAISPVIFPISIKEHKRLTDPAKIEFKISDNLSGIASFRGEIDGQWVLFEYDAKSSKLCYNLDKQRITQNKSHHLVLTVTDNRSNKATYEANFIW